MAIDYAGTTLSGSWARRHYQRVLAHVELVVEWEQSEQLQSIEAFTIDVSRSGCLAVVGTDLQLAQNVRLINRLSGSAAEARVVWRNPRTQDVGLELLKPDAAFWNV